MVGYIEGPLSLELSQLHVTLTSSTTPRVVGWDSKVFSFRLERFCSPGGLF